MEEVSMRTASLPNEFQKTRVRWPSIVWQTFAGFLFGYFALHPISMVIFQWLDPRLAETMPDGMTRDVWGPVAHSFRLAMLPMGLVFGVIGAAIVAFYGYHRLALRIKNDRLTLQLRRNEQLRAELAEQAEELRQNNEELARLELANRRTTQFMAHDFKTALNCVGGFAGQLLEGPDLRENQKVLEALTCIRRQAHRMMGSVTDLLEFARSREGGAPQMEPISVTGLLHESVGDFSIPAHTERIALGEQYATCPAVWGDPRLLRRVLCNLISNAIKHNGPGTHVSLDAQMDESNEHVLFSCRDDGAGIPTKVLPEIFTEFTTTGNTSCGSTGLGLAFCKSVVEAHGGRIWCENLPQGAQFLFTIPLHKEHNNDQ